MKKLLIIPGAIALLAASSASADPQRPGWYIGLTGGVAFLDSTDIHGANTGNVSYNTGGMGAVSLGYAPPSGIWLLSDMRFEAELGYHDNSLYDASLGGSPTPVAGNLQSVSYMANAYYDMRNSSNFTPYVGAGAGGATVRLSRNSGLGNTTSSNTVFAYQFMGGISYAPEWMPQTEWGIGYRYFAENRPEFDTAGGKFKLENAVAQDAEINARFHF